MARTNINVPSVIRSIPHGSELPVPLPDGNMEYNSDFQRSAMTVVARNDTYKPKEDN